MKYLSLAALPLFLLGCDDGTGSKSTDTDTEVDTETMDTEMDTEVEVVEPTAELSFDTTGWTDGWSDAVTCADDVFTLQLRTERWGFDAEVYMGDTRFNPPWEEAGHLMAETDSSGSDYDTTTGAPGYSVFELELDLVGTIGEVVPGSTTLHGCDDLLADESNFSITYAAAVFKEDGTLADCIVFGHDPAALLDGTADDLAPPSWVDDPLCRQVD